jgi:hypothetical protein
MAKSAEPTELEVLQSISTKLDQILTLLIMKGSDQDESIRVLRIFGSDWGTIAKLTRLTPDPARMRFNYKGKKQ